MTSINNIITANNITITVAHC